MSHRNIGLEADLARAAEKQDWFLMAETIGRILIGIEERIAETGGLMEDGLTIRTESGRE